MKYVAILLVIILLGCGIGFMCYRNLDSVSEHKVTEQQSVNENITGYEGEGGGNPQKENDKVEVFSILVNNDEYLYENEPIELEEIIDKLRAKEHDFYVEIKDNNATYRAYSKLVSALEELKIRVEEVE